MRLNLNRLIAVFVGILAMLSLTTCSFGTFKTHPEYPGVDPKAQDLVDEYKMLAKIQNLTFKHNVTIGFKTIKEKNVIGICNYGLDWREIDLSQEYWAYSTNISHLSLLYHELTHCYCGREHDYNGKDYPDIDELEKLAKAGKIGGGAFYSDLCPKSIMFPIILDDGCLLAHYNDYVIEMFSRCEPF